MVRLGKWEEALAMVGPEGGFGGALDYSSDGRGDGGIKVRLIVSSVLDRHT